MYMDYPYFFLLFGLLTIFLYLQNQNFKFDFGVGGDLFLIIEALNKQKVPHELAHNCTKSVVLLYVFKLFPPINHNIYTSPKKLILFSDVYKKDLSNA